MKRKNINVLTQTKLETPNYGYNYGYNYILTMDIANAGLSAMNFKQSKFFKRKIFKKIFFKYI